MYAAGVLWMFHHKTGFSPTIFYFQGICSPSTIDISSQNRFQLHPKYNGHFVPELVLDPLFLLLTGL